MLVKRCINRLLKMDILNRRCQIISKGKLKIKKNITGKGHVLRVGKNSILDGVVILMNGNGNTVEIGNNCRIEKNCSIWAEGNNIRVIIGDNCTFNHDTQLCAQENDMEIVIGDDCMLSHHVNVRTSDSHKIFDIQSDNRTNFPRSVIIGKHVWIAPNSIVMKGVNVGDGCIIGSNTIVTRNVSSNTLAVGMPAKIVREGVSWSREKLF